MGEAKEQSGDISVTNCIHVERLSLLYRYFFFVDGKEYSAEHIFRDNKIKISVLQRYVQNNDGRYSIYLVKVRKKDTGVFLDCMEQLYKSMLLTGHSDYPELCHGLIEKIKQKSKKSVL